MDEVFPVLVGIAVGLASLTRKLDRTNLLLVVLIGVFGAGLATWISGEWVQSWFYIVVDAAEIAITAVVTRFVFSRQRFSDLIRRLRASA